MHGGQKKVYGTDDYAYSAQRLHNLFRGNSNSRRLCLRVELGHRRSGQSYRRPKQISRITLAKYSPILLINGKEVDKLVRSSLFQKAYDERQPQWQGLVRRPRH